MASKRKNKNQNIELEDSTDIPHSSDSQLGLDVEENKYFCTPKFCNSHVMVRNKASRNNSLSSISSTCQLEIISSEFQSYSQRENETISQLLKTLRLKGGKGSKKDSKTEPPCPDCEAAKAAKETKLLATQDRKERKLINKMSSRCQLHEDLRSGRQSQSSDLETETPRRSEQDTKPEPVEADKEKERQRKSEDADSAVTADKSKSELLVKEREANKQSLVRIAIDSDKEEASASARRTSKDKDKDRKGSKTDSERESLTVDDSQPSQSVGLAKRKSRIKNVLKFVRSGTRTTAGDEVMRVDETPGTSLPKPQKSKDEGGGPFYSRLNINSTDVYKLTMFIVFYNVFNNLK